jgi:ribosome-associated toxin RatA of RatAB toxin-antitoxin module
MRRYDKLLLWGVLLMVLGASGAAGETVRLLGMDLDLNTVLMMIDRGEVGVIESNADGTFKTASGMILVKAPLETVWAFVTNFGAYVQTMPNVGESTVLAEEPGPPRTVTVKYELKVPLSNLRYQLRHKLLEQRRIESTWLEGDLEGTFNNWEFHAIRGGGETLVAYELYSPVMEKNWIMRHLRRSNPAMEHGINVAAALMTLRAVREGLEQNGP